MEKKPKYDNRKVSIYLPRVILEEVEKVALEYGNSVSKVFQDCFSLAKYNCRNWTKAVGTSTFASDLKKRADQ